MIVGSIARRWAKALFLLGEEKGNLAALVREVSSMAEAWESSEELRTTMTNPMLDENARASIWEGLITALRVSPLTKNFFKLLRDKNRIGEIASIARELQALADVKENNIRAEVVSAVPLREDVVNQLKLAIQKNTGKIALVTRREDSALVGGIITRVGDLMYDGSIRTQLQRMKEGMLNESS